MFYCMHVRIRGIRVGNRPGLPGPWTKETTDEGAWRKVSAVVASLLILIAIPVVAIVVRSAVVTDYPWIRTPLAAVRKQGNTSAGRNPVAMF